MPKRAKSTQAHSRARQPDDNEDYSKDLFSFQDLAQSRDHRFVSKAFSKDALTIRVELHVICSDFHYYLMLTHDVVQTQCATLILTCSRS